MTEPALTLVTRADCSLCEDLARDLYQLDVPFATVDIDKDAELLRLYDECVPVLLFDGVELSHAPFTPASLQQSLKAAGVLR
jgi:glutaredoxin